MLEFCVVVAVFGLVLLFFFERVSIYQEMAEKTAAEVTVQNMRTGLRYRVAEMLLHQQEREITGLVGSNPIKLLDLPPANYAGEFVSNRLDQVPPGSWYFDPGKGEIAYRIRRHRYFAAGAGGQAELRFRVNASFRKAGADGSVLLAEGVNLSLLTPYQWLFD